MVTNIERTYLCEQADINCKTITIHQEVTKNETAKTRQKVTIKGVTF